MESGGQGSVVYRVSRGFDGRWEVTENGFERLLASFEERQQACDYANGLIMASEGAAMLVLDEGSLRPLRQAADGARPPR